MALLCASLLNCGTTRLRTIANIEEVDRLLEVMEALGVSVERKENGDLCLTPPKICTLDGLGHHAFKRIRSGLMLIPGIALRHASFKIPAPGGCKMGKRTTIAHVRGLSQLGIVLAPQSDHFTVCLLYTSPSPRD